MGLVSRLTRLAAARETSREMDFAHPAPPERREKSVGLDLRPRHLTLLLSGRIFDERIVGHRPGRDFDGRRLDEVVARNVTSEQACDLAAQSFIPSAGFVEEGFARFRFVFERRVIQPFDLFPAITLHHFAPRSDSPAAAIWRTASRSGVGLCGVMELL